MNFITVIALIVDLIIFMLVVLKSNDSDTTYYGSLLPAIGCFLLELTITPIVLSVIRICFFQ